MICDRDIANVCAAIYDPTTNNWERRWAGRANTDDIYAAMAGDVLCFRGSITLTDWLRDLDALPFDDPRLGGLHAGFSEGLFQFYTAILQFCSPNTIVCGHSLGAARALIFAGYMAQAGINPRAVITFGSPRPGFQKLADILQGTTIRSYKNRADPVTTVPVPFSPDLAYIHPRYLSMVNVTPPLSAVFDPLADHSINLYCQGTPATEIV